MNSEAYNVHRVACFAVHAGIVSQNGNTISGSRKPGCRRWPCSGIQNRRRAFQTCRLSFFRPV